MTLDTARPDRARGSTVLGGPLKFHEVFQEEIALINIRRARNARAAIDLQTEAAEDMAREPVLAPAEDANVIGLALSGGGIRSAALCLGALQALEEAAVLKFVDYLSTVSGGGYIGCALTAALEQTQTQGWTFPFTSRLNEDEPPALQHIRDYSNYLFPSGASDLLHNASIYARGLVANAVLLAPFLLAASAITLLLYSPLNPFDLPHFFVTVDLALLLAVLGILWSLYQSTTSGERKTEIPSNWSRGVGLVVIVLLVAIFCELQPFVLDEMVHDGTGNFLNLPRWINTISAIVAPLATAAAFLASKLGEFVKSTSEFAEEARADKRPYRESVNLRCWTGRASFYLGGLSQAHAVGAWHRPHKALSVSVPWRFEGRRRSNIVLWHRCFPFYCHLVHATECEFVASALSRSSRQGVPV